MSNASRPLSDDYYDLLGVARTASGEEIKAAEQALRKIYESRAHQGDPVANDITRRLNEAHATLQVTHRRAAYDREPASIAGGFADVAHSPPIGRLDKLGLIASWMGEHELPMPSDAELLPMIALRDPPGDA